VITNPSLNILDSSIILPDVHDRIELLRSNIILCIIQAWVVPDDIFSNLFVTQMFIIICICLPEKLLILMPLNIILLNFLPDFTEFQFITSIGIKVIESSFKLSVFDKMIFMIISSDPRVLLMLPFSHSNLLISVEVDRLIIRSGISGII
jgi:hypothetical protein